MLNSSHSGVPTGVVVLLVQLNLVLRTYSNGVQGLGEVLRDYL